MLPKILREGRYAVLDAETTGLSVTRDEIVELALIQVDYGVPRLQVSTRVRPRRAEWGYDAEEVHGISERSLDHAPFLSEVAADLLHLIGDRALIGWQIGQFDYRILTRQLREEGAGIWRHDLIDALKWARKLLPKPHGLQAVATALEVKPGVYVAHKALDDCRLTWNIFVKLATRFPELGDLAQECAITHLKEELTILPEGLDL